MMPARPGLTGRAGAVFLAGRSGCGGLQCPACEDSDQASLASSPQQPVAAIPSDGRAGLPIDGRPRMEPGSNGGDMRKLIVSSLVSLDGHPRC